MHYEIKRMCNARTHKKVRELWVEWQGYDQSQNGWVSRESLMQDVPALVWAFERNPSNFTPRASASKRASVVPSSQVCVGGANLGASGCLLSVGGGRQRAHSDGQTQEQGAATSVSFNWA